MEENKGEENLLRDSDQVIHSVILKGATMRRRSEEKKDREPFALLCKCNIASGSSRRSSWLQALRDWGGKELKAAGWKTSWCWIGPERSWPAGWRERERIQRLQQRIQTPGLHCSQVRQAGKGRLGWIRVRLDHQQPTIVCMSFFIYSIVCMSFFFYSITLYINCVCVSGEIVL